MHRARLQQAPARQRVLMPPEQHQQVFRVSRSSPTPDETGRRERPSPRDLARLIHFRVLYSLAVHSVCPISVHYS